MPGLALAFLAGFGFFALGVRMVVQFRRTGSTGLVGISGSPGSIEWMGGMLFGTAIGICVAGPLLQSLGTVDPIEALDGDLAAILGACLAVVGIALTVLAQLAMGDAWRIGVDPSERTELVTSGVFAVVRNPIYTATIPAFAGIALLAPNFVTIAGVILLAVAVDLQTRFVEEPYLSSVHGEQYDAYAARVGRFLPAIGRLGSGKAPPRG